MPNKRRKVVKSGCAFLCLLSFAQAKESTVAHRAKPAPKKLKFAIKTKKLITSPPFYSKIPHMLPNRKQT